ncbi:MAG: hypothetical protein AAGC60_15075 [Acidobacteriota bacterium]
METFVLFVLLVLSLGGVWIYFDAARVRDAHAIGVGPGNRPPHRWAALTVLTLFVSMRWYLAARARAVDEPRRHGPPPRFEAGGLQTFAFVVAAVGLAGFVACLAFGEVRASVLGLLVIALGWFGGREGRDTGHAESFEIPQSAGWEQVGFVAPENEMDEDEDEPLLDLDQVAARRRQAGPTGLPTGAPRTTPHQAPPARPPSPAPRQPASPHTAPGPVTPRPAVTQPPAAPGPKAPAPPPRQQPPPPPPGVGAHQPVAGRSTPGAPGEDVVDLHSLLGSSGPPPAPAATTASSQAPPDPASSRSPAAGPPATGQQPQRSQQPPPPNVARTDGIEFALDDRAVERSVRVVTPRARAHQPAQPRPPQAPTPQAPTPQASTPQGQAQQAPTPRAPRPSPPKTPTAAPAPAGAPTPRPRTPTARGASSDGPIPLPTAPPRPIGAAYAASSARRGVPGIALVAVLVALVAAGAALGWMVWSRGDDATPASTSDGPMEAPSSEGTEASVQAAPSPTPIDEALAASDEQLSDDLRASMSAWAIDYRRLFDPVADRIEAVDFDGFDDPSCYALRDALGVARSDLPDADDDSIRDHISNALINFDRAAAACLERDVEGWSKHVLNGKAATHAAQAVLAERYAEDGLLDLELESASGDTRSRSSMTGRYLAQQELDF